MSALPPIDAGGATLGLGLLACLVALAVRPVVAQTGPGTQAQDLERAYGRRGFPAIATADSNGRMIAVTGIDLTGSSVLYLVDTENQQLAVYQASGGSESSQGVKLIGARRIDLDLKLHGYNDRSEYSYEDLETRFDALRSPPRPAK